MSNSIVNNKLILYPATSSTSKYPNSSNNRGGNKDNCSGESFQDILMQKLESQVQTSSEASLITLQALLSKRLHY